MALKIISLVFVISLAFGMVTPNQVKDVPFNVNEVINRVSPHHPLTPNPQSLSPTLPTGEFLIDTGIAYVPADNDQRSPSVAFDGTNYFVVWEDYRSGLNYEIDIYGTRVSQTGAILDPVGIPISTVDDNQRSPSVAFDGTNYLVVWEDERGHPNTYDIYGARVNQEGVVLDPNRIVISALAGNQLNPAVVFDGINYLVVWEDSRTGSYYDIYCTRMNQAGVVLDTNGIAISTARYDQTLPSVAFDGINCLIVWQDFRSGWDYDVLGARVNQSGIVLDLNGIAISVPSNDQYAPAVTFDGTNYLVVWQDERNGDTSDIYGARVNRAGGVLDPSGIAITTAANAQYSPSVAFAGTNYLVVWQDRRNYPSFDIYGARVNQAGLVLDSIGIAISTAMYDQGEPSVAFNDTNYLVVWQDNRNSSFDIYGARVSQTGTILDSAGTVISLAAYWQSSPSVAFDSTNYLVAWQDNRNSQFDIYGARVSQTGSVLDANSIAISTAAYSQVSPSVAFDGTNYLVVWQDNRNGSFDIYGARVSPTGAVLDTSGIAISTTADDQYSSSIACNGTNHFVVWTDERNGRGNIYGARVSQTGTVLDSAGIALSHEAYWQWTPSVAFDGINYFVVWENFLGIENIHGARVSQTGIVLDPNGIVISRAGHPQLHPAVAFDGTNYLVVWEDGRSGSRCEIYGARVSQTGTVLDPGGISITTIAGYRGLPSLAFNGTNYLGVWQEYRSFSWDIYGAKISQAGLVIDSFAISSQRGDQISPALARGPGNQMLITYSGWTDSVNEHPANTVRIWGKFYPFVPGIAEEKSKVKTQKAKLLEVYPNPAKAMIYVRVPPTFCSSLRSDDSSSCLPQSASGGGEDRRRRIKIFDVSGKMVKEIATPSARNDEMGEAKISLKGINPGMYFLRLGKETKKFLVIK